MYKFSGIHEYDEHMDEECIHLCDALNCLPGVKTRESCCGHGDRPFTIWFSCTSDISLRFLGRCIDRRYWEFGSNWRIELENSDVNYDYSVFTLISHGYWGNVLKNTLGSDAYNQANDLIDNMEWHLNCKPYIDAFIKDLSEFKIIDVDKLKQLIQSF